MLLGSVSNAVVNHSRVPVLVVPGPAGEGPTLLCYDGSAPAEHAIARAGELLEPAAATVLGCWESWTAEAPALAGASKAVMGMASELDEVAAEGSAEEVGRGVELARAAGLAATPLSARSNGPIWRTILDTADARDASAVVLGSRGVSGLSAALGSVSHGVAHHSRRPVLIIPLESGAL
jgi:nucleotide-binding universal stress UspA family protein